MSEITQLIGSPASCRRDPGGGTDTEPGSSGNGRRQTGHPPRDSFRHGSTQTYSRYSDEKTGFGHRGHIGHRTRHGAPAGPGGIRHHGDGPALRLAAEGYDIIATGRRSERLESLRREIEAAGDRCTTLTFDVRSEEAVRRNLEPLGRVDLLVNNAGLAAGLEHIDKGDTADWDAMIDTNVKGLLYVTRVITPKMVAAGGGHVFNIGSIAGTEPYENGAVYCASKHAVHAISQAMRADLLASGIKVTEIRPGMVETEFSEVRFHGDKERADRVYDGVEPLTGDDIAEAIAWAAQLPAHMTVNEMVLMPSQQAGAYYTHRKN